MVIGASVADELCSQVSARLTEAPDGVLFTSEGVDALESSMQSVTGAGATVITGGQRSEHPGYRWKNTLLRTTALQFVQEPLMQTELFGPVAMLIVAENIKQAEDVAGALEGQLTGSIYSAEGSADDDPAMRIKQSLVSKVGRIMENKMPTGVAVSPAMVHGGPFPATGNALFTSVGLPTSIQRFATRRCYDAVRPDRLPEILRG